MRATTLFEIRTEEKVIAAQGWGSASARQVAFAIVATAVAAGLYFGVSAVLRVLGAGTSGGVFGAVLAVCGAGVVSIVGFAPATALRYVPVVPSPELPGPTDPTLPPMRLDTWLLIVYRHRRRARRLLYKRG